MSTAMKAAWAEAKSMSMPSATAQDAQEAGLAAGDLQKP
jgi:hypothetical protein